MTEEHKNWIDGASYETLLRRWRHSPSTDTIFHDETGVYYTNTMATKKSAMSQSEIVSASKKIGW